METLTPDFVVMGLLAVRPCHGYELINCFAAPDQLGRVWHMSTSQIYAVLKRLERQCWIAGEQHTSETAPPRTAYRLTDEGRDQFERWLHDSEPSASVRRVRVEFLSRLFIARALNLPTHAIVRAQVTACTGKRDALVRQRDEGAAPGMEYVTLEFEISQLNAILDWIARVEFTPRD